MLFKHHFGDRVSFVRGVRYTEVRLDKHIIAEYNKQWDLTHTYRGNVSRYFPYNRGKDRLLLENLFGIKGTYQSVTLNRDL